MLLHFRIKFGLGQLNVSLILLGLALGLSHAGIVNNLGVRWQVLLLRLLALLGHLNKLLEGWCKGAEDFLGVLLNMRSNDRI